MVTWRENPVDEASAHRLLSEYFDYRARTFPGGDYHAAFPAPADFEHPRGVFLVAEDAETDVGCGGVRMIAPGASGLARFEVKHLWLQPAIRGRGIGRALLDELELRAGELGAEELVLDTNASLEAAAGLYRSSGYVAIEPYNDNPNATTWFRKRVGGSSSGNHWAGGEIPPHQHHASDRAGDKGRMVVPADVPERIGRSEGTTP